MSSPKNVARRRTLTLEERGEVVNVVWPGTFPDVALPAFLDRCKSVREVEMGLPCKTLGKKRAAIESEILKRERG